MINGISTTDVYQKALPIMGHDYANKYANYYAKKQKTIKSCLLYTSDAADD